MAASDRRGLLIAVVGCVLAAALLLLSSGWVWLDVALPALAPLPGVRDMLTGQELAPMLVPVGILTGAAGLALIATRRLGRLVVAAVLVAAGLLVAARVGFLLYDDGSLAALSWAQTRSPSVGDSPFPQRDLFEVPAVFALIAGGMVVAVGALVMFGSRRWPVMGQRYERRTRSAVEQAPATGEATMWAALDRGQDPTAAPAPPPS